MTAPSLNGSLSTGPAEPRDPRLAVGTILFLASEVLVFAGFFAAYFSLAAANEVWPPEDVDLDVLRAVAFTGIFVLSAATMWLSVRSVRAGRQGESDRWLAATAVLGVVFVVSTLVELLTLDFGIDTDAYGSIFVLTVVVHWLHAVAGLVIVGAALVVSAGAGRAPLLSTRTATSYYWYFTVAVSVAVLAVLYLIQ